MATVNWVLLGTSQSFKSLVRCDSASSLNLRQCRLGRLTSTISAETKDGKPLTNTKPWCKSGLGVQGLPGLALWKTENVSPDSKRQCSITRPVWSYGRPYSLPCLEIRAYLRFQVGKVRVHGVLSCLSSTLSCRLSLLMRRLRTLQPNSAATRVYAQSSRRLLRKRLPPGHTPVVYGEPGQTARQPGVLH